ncbi:MAG: hypothetical protein HYY16_05130 [Planctomycetes bacterium]|nr:hypothetical protein [Planctomycetota bacterium]
MRWGHARTQSRFHVASYIFRRKVFKLFGASFHVYDENWNVVMFSKQKAFKLREDIRIYADESMQRELLVIKARQIIDFGATYDVTDATTGEVVGSLRRKGLASLLRDTWLVFDAQGQERGKLLEDSTVMALIRRFLTNLIPQNFTLQVGDREAAHIHQHFNPFILRYTMDLTGNNGSLDPRLAVAAGVLLCGIEGRQN